MSGWEEGTINCDIERKLVKKSYDAWVGNQSVTTTQETPYDGVLNNGPSFFASLNDMTELFGPPFLRYIENPNAQTNFEWVCIHSHHPFIAHIRFGDEEDLGYGGKLGVLKKNIAVFDLEKRGSMNDADEPVQWFVKCEDETEGLRFVDYIVDLIQPDVVLK
jgi:hypothetical protein